MERLLSRARFVELIARGLDMAPEDLDVEAPAANGLDPVTLHRLDEFVSIEFGVELPENVLSPSSDIDTIYRAYVLERVATDLRTPGSPS